MAMRGINTTQPRYKLQETDLIHGEDKQYVLRLRDLAEDDKPRERLIAGGPETLSSAELLAIVLNTGTRKEDVLEMTKRVMQEYGTTSIVTQKNPQKLHEELDIPIVKSCQIVACFELGRRFFDKKSGRKMTIRNARQVKNYLKDMAFLKKEQLRGIYLNSRYQIVHDEVISIGSLTANIVHPREVFRPALENSAAAVIIAHNHPSGSSKPSDADIVITKQIVEAGEILGIDVLDHIIITKHGFSSIPTNINF